VLAVLALASVLVVPAVQPALDAVRAEAGIRRTAAFLDDARRRSVLERKTLTVRCRFRENQLELGRPGGEPAIFRIPEPLTLAECRPELLRYFPQGAATGMALSLRDPRGRERLISVGSFTGLARVEDQP